MSVAPWLQQAGETGEAYAAFRLFYQAFRHDIDRAWQRFSFPLNAPPTHGSADYLAPARWHHWRAEHRWDERVQAAEAEEQRLAEQEREKQAGNALCWSDERKDDFRDLLAIYKNLRKSLVALTSTGELRNTVRKTVSRVEGAWQTTEDSVYAVEQLKFVERTRPVLFPPDNSKPLLPDGGSLFLDLDTIAEQNLAPLPEREHATDESVFTASTVPASDESARG